MCACGRTASRTSPPWSRSCARCSRCSERCSAMTACGRPRHLLRRLPRENPAALHRRPSASLRSRRASPPGHLAGSQRPRAASDARDGPATGCTPWRAPPALPQRLRLRASQNPSTATFLRIHLEKNTEAHPPTVARNRQGRLVGFSTPVKFRESIGGARQCCPRPHSRSPKRWHRDSPWVPLDEDGGEWATLVYYQPVQLAKTEVYAVIRRGRYGARPRLVSAWTVLLGSRDGLPLAELLRLHRGKQGQ